jgi:hypothetical protein
MEVFCAMQFAGVIQMPSRNVLVVTTPKMVDEFNYLGFGVANLEKIHPRLSHLGNEYSAVVLTRGVIGGVNDMPPSFHFTNEACEKMLVMVKELCVCAPDVVVICGPFDYWQDIPEWFSYLAGHYELRAARPHMGCQPMFWAFGTRGVSKLKRVITMMKAMYLDLQLSGKTSSSMRLAGLTRFPFKHKLFEDSASTSLLPKDAWLNVDDAVHNTGHPVVRGISLFLIMKSLGLAPLAIAQAWAGLK